MDKSSVQTSRPTIYLPDVDSRQTTHQHVLNIANSHVDEQTARGLALTGLIFLFSTGHFERSLQLQVQYAILQLCT